MVKLLEVKNLRAEFKTDIGIVKAVNDVSYFIGEQEIVGIVGESGCGKSVTQLSVMGLLDLPGKISGGQILFEGNDLLKYGADGPEMQSIRGAEISMIFQEPMTSLNPVLTIGQQLIEMLQLHLGMNKAVAYRRAAELLSLTGIPSADSRLNDYPHQFSGGMRQRVMIAMGLSCNPKILIADEPTTALDVTTQAQLLELMNDMVQQFSTSLVIVTHNLGVVARYAHRIYVMYAGKIIESGSCKEIFNNPRHPYTIGLLNCVPRLDSERRRRLESINGMPPNLVDMPECCAFLPRCPYSIERCRIEPCPDLKSVGDEHYSRCFVNPKKINVITQAEIRTDIKTSIKDNDVLMDVKNLKIYFPISRGLLKRKIADIKAVDGVTFQLKRGETLSLVGESGCGKTSLGRSLIRLYQPEGGQIFFEGEDISKQSKRKLRHLRSKITMTFQDPYSSLDPRQSAFSIVGEPLKVHNIVNSRKEYNKKVEKLFLMVGLDPKLGDRFPHEFSGGQRQRIGIARALACNPSLIICDEPISALDVSVQAQIINLFEKLKEDLGSLTYLFIAHDLAVVQHVSDRIAVMYLGRIVEIAEPGELYHNPLHPYTRALLSAIPIPDPNIEEKRERIILRGEVPSPINPPSGCKFNVRCDMATEKCRKETPSLREIGKGHKVACIRM